MDKISEDILRRRMHGLYITRKCEGLTQLSHELLGLHCWFHRNVVFSGLIRGTDLTGWKTRLTKTWIHRGTLHGVVFEDLPKLLALHSDEFYFPWLGLSDEQIEDVSNKVINLMEDGIYSRAEMRRIFAYDYDEQMIERIFSSWGGIFAYLARIGKVAFRDMTSRNFDLISAEPTQTPEDVLPELFSEFISAYGPATLNDAAWFLGLSKEQKVDLNKLNLDEYSRLEYNGDIYYYTDNNADMGDIPKITLLSGFDPLIVSYVERSTILPKEYKSKVVTKSGICLPTIAIDGKVAGLWNIKKGEPVVEFFSSQPKPIQNTIYDLVDNIRQQSAWLI